MVCHGFPLDQIDRTWPRAPAPTIPFGVLVATGFLAAWAGHEEEGAGRLLHARGRDALGSRVCLSCASSKLALRRLPSSWPDLLLRRIFSRQTGVALGSLTGRREMAFYIYIHQQELALAERACTSGHWIRLLYQLSILVTNCKIGICYLLLRALCQRSGGTRTETWPQFAIRLGRRDGSTGRRN